MLSCTKALLWGCASVLLLASGARAGDDCTDGPMNQPLTTIGRTKSDGEGFCHSKWKDGLVVTAIEAWTTKWQIKGIEFTYSDGTKNMQGRPVDGGKEGDHVILSWNKDSPISNLIIAPNKVGDGLGRLGFTVEGKDFIISSEHGDIKRVNVGSGILLGASGQAGDYVYQWTPLFLGTISKDATVLDIQYDQNLDDINKQKTGIEQITLNEAYIKNTNPADSEGKDQAYTFGVDTTRKMAITDSQTTTHTFGKELSLQLSGRAGIPLVTESGPEAGTSAKYEYQNAKTHTAEDAKTVTLKWTLGSTKDTDFVQPGHAKHCKAWTYQGNYSGGYTKIIEILVSGQKYNFRQRGTIDTISYTRAGGSCEDIILYDVPNEAKLVNAEDTLKDNADAKRAVAFTA